MTAWLFLLSSPGRLGAAPLPQLLADAGHQVTAVATDDFAVEALVHGAAGPLLESGVELLYDEAALIRRGLVERVDPATRCTHAEIAARVLARDVRVIWR